jgi:ATP-dependent Lhr-like helicase
LNNKPTPHDASAAEASSAARLKAALPRVWTAFFARYGNFTPIQQHAMPAILDGENLLLIAPTAGGKTEAAIAPLLERILHAHADRNAALRVLYICPTRALVRDLYERLRRPLATLRIDLGMKTGDTGPVSLQAPPTILITTPESTDSLLTRGARVFTDLEAVILDEIHLFDHSPRGDHLRCLLQRIEHVRAFARTEDNPVDFRPVQRIAISATVSDTAGITARYLSIKGRSTRTIAAGSGRQLDAVIEFMTGLGNLPALLRQRSSGQRGLRKSLLFCNTRNEVEQTAAYLRNHLPYEASIFVHYSNLDGAVRRQSEQAFAEAAVAICVCSSTLELGIDIGSIDDVVLLGPPPTLTSFLQRIGRGGRRTGRTSVLGLARSPLEAARFRALVAAAQEQVAAPAFTHPVYRFRPSVLVQQTFSILKQSPTGAVRLADLERVAPDEVASTAPKQVLAELTRRGFLRTGRLGEWRPGPDLEPLLDQHEIYSNIGADPLSVAIIDAYSGRTIAQTNRVRIEGDTLLLGGRTMEVVWRDRYRIAVRQGESVPADETLRFITKPFAVPLGATQTIARQLNLSPHVLLTLAADEGTYLFHFWGDIYGALLTGLLRGGVGTEDAVRQVNEICLHTTQRRLPPLAWNDRAVRRTLHILRPTLEESLELGRFHSLLPPQLAAATVDELIDVPRFAWLVHNAKVQPAPAQMRMALLALAR